MGRGDGAVGAVVWVGASEDDEGTADCDGGFVGAGVCDLVGVGLGVRVGFGLGVGFGVGEGFAVLVGVGLAVGEGFGDLEAFAVFLSSRALGSARPGPRAVDVANASQNGIFMILASSHG